MTQHDTRRFRVHARHLARHEAMLVQATSFESAAIAFVERSHLAPDGPDLRVIVHDLGSGHEHCFRIDLASGDTAACS